MEILKQSIEENNKKFQKALNELFVKVTELKTKIQTNKEILELIKKEEENEKISNK